MRNFAGGVTEIAHALRHGAGQTTPPYSVPAILGAAFPDAVVTGRELPDGIEEVVAQLDDGPLILYRRELPILDQRFAIAHAMAHLLWDLGCAAYVVDGDREARADAFALELLAPDEELRERIVFWPVDSGPDRDIYLDQVDRIAARFGVPSSEIDKRIRHLERVGTHVD